MASKDVSRFVMLGKLVSEQPRRSGKLTMPKYKPHWYDRFIEPFLFLAMILAIMMSFTCFAYSFLMLQKLVNG